MEQILFIMSMAALGLSFCIFLLGVLNNGINNLFKTKYAKASGILFLAYIVTFAPYIIISN